jgi:hypothetical protein
VASIDAAVAALIASGVAAAGAVISQIFVQRATSDREARAAHRREERTRALIDGQLAALEPYLAQQVRSGTIWVIARLERRIAALKLHADDRSVVIELDATSVGAVIAFVGSIELALDNMQILLDQYRHDYESAADGDAKAAAGDRLRRSLMNLFIESLSRLHTARGSLNPDKTFTMPFPVTTNYLSIAGLIQRRMMKQQARPEQRSIGDDAPE